MPSAGGGSGSRAAQRPVGIAQYVPFLFVIGHAAPHADQRTSSNRSRAERRHRGRSHGRHRIRRREDPRAPSGVAGHAYPGGRAAERRRRPSGCPGQSVAPGAAPGADSRALSSSDARGLRRGRDAAAMPTAIFRTVVFRLAWVGAASPGAGRCHLISGWPTRASSLRRASG